MHRSRVRRTFAHRPLWLRALITLWGVWFTTALTEPAGLFACQMHSGMNTGHGVHAAQSIAATPAAANRAAAVLAVNEASPGAMDHAAMGHGATAGDDVAGASQSHVGAVASDAPAPEQHNCCTCLGQCCTAPPAAAPVCAPAFATETISDVVRAEFAERAYVPLQRAHALPYANGPPLTA